MGGRRECGGDSAFDHAARHSDYGAFADDCVSHENGYQTVNNPPPGDAIEVQMLPCSEQISSETFAYMKHIRRREAQAVLRACCRIW